MNDLAQPVGNTSEASSSMGASGRLYSPFSPTYNPTAAKKISAIASKRMRRNPPLSGEERQKILAY